jgi:protein-disulfide isomerase
MPLNDKGPSDWSAKLVNVAISVAMTIVAIGVGSRLLAGITGGTNIAEEQAALERFSALAAEGSRIGPPDAPVALVVFTDYQCPSCAKFEERLALVRDRIEEPFAIVVRHAPLNRIHPQARTAALAAECAGAEGRFAAMHDALFERAENVGEGNWAQIANAAGVTDSTRFMRCVSGGDMNRVIERDSAATLAIQFRGTPTLVTAQSLVPGVPPDAELERMIRASLESRERR